MTSFPTRGAVTAHFLTEETGAFLHVDPLLAMVMTARTGAIGWVLDPSLCPVTMHLRGASVVALIGNPRLLPKLKRLTTGVQVVVVRCLRWNDLVLPLVRRRAFPKLKLVPHTLLMLRRSGQKVPSFLRPLRSSRLLARPHARVHSSVETKGQIVQGVTKNPTTGALVNAVDHSRLPTGVMTEASFLLLPCV